MKRSVKEPALLQHVAAQCRGVITSSPYGTGCWLLVILLCACTGCHAGHPLRSLSDTPSFTPNISLAADNICLKDVVQEGQYNYYSLDISGCFDDNSNAFVGVEARIYPANPPCENCQEWSLLVNTAGELPTFEDSEGPNSGTFVDSIDPEHQRPFTHLDLPKGGYASSPWAVAVYSSSGPVQYTLKAWCSVSKGCNLSCSDPDSGPCVSLETCRCIKEADEETCRLDVDVLPDVDDDVARNGLSIFHNDEMLRYGEWKYFQFQVLENDSRILVELARASGDVIVFLKPQDGENKVQDALPTEADANKYSDLASFQNRLSHHHIYANGAGVYYIGVYNTDHCVREDTTFNLTVTIATADNPLNLCPLNCSYPQGICVRDNHCECEAGFGGSFCGGSLWPAAPRQSYSGQLQPGGWAYVNLMRSELTDSGNVSIKFTCSGGHSILLAQQSGYPTLTDYYLKFSDERLGATTPNTYHIDRSSLDNGNIILAVFNVDYEHQGVSHFEIIILGALKGFSIWIILAAALGSSVLVFIMMGTFRYGMQRRGVDGMDSDGLDFEATPHDTEMMEMRVGDRVMVSTFPLLAYQEGLFPKEEAGCAICLNNYHIAELLCRIPACKHIFHVKCIDEWFQKDPSCPLCRVSLQESHSIAQGSGQSSGPLAPGLRPPMPGPSDGTQFPAKGLDPQASSSSSQYVGSQENPAPLTDKDYQPLLVRRDTSSLESSSGSDSDSNPLNVQRPRKAAAIVSLPQLDRALQEGIAYYNKLIDNFM